jgi:hypothetical protein
MKSALHLGEISDDHASPRGLSSTMNKEQSTRNFCSQCGKKIETSFQTRFCSRECWIKYKKEHSMAVSPERQATVFIKTPFSEGESSSVPREDIRIVPPEHPSPRKEITSTQGSRAPKSAPVLGKQNVDSNQNKKRNRPRHRSEVDHFKHLLAIKDREIKSLRRKIRELNEELQKYRPPVAPTALVTSDSTVAPPVFTDNRDTVNDIIPLHEDSTKLKKRSFWTRFFSFKRSDHA